MAEKVTGFRKLFGKDGYWFTTKTGKHVFVENGKSMQSYKDDKKANIIEKRGTLSAKAQLAQQGYEKEDMIQEGLNDWSRSPEKKYAAFRTKDKEYITKEGKLTKNLNDAYVMKQSDLDAPGGYKKLYEVADKNGIDSWGLDRTRIIKYPDKSIDNLDDLTAQGYQVASNLQAEGKGIKTFDFNSARVDEKEASKISQMAETAYGGNRKTSRVRAGKFAEIDRELDRYYKKHPVDISDAEIEADLSRNSKNMVKSYYGGLNKIVERQEALERATYGDIAPRGSSAEWGYSDMLSLGTQVKDKFEKRGKDEPWVMTAREKFALQTLNREQDNPIKAKEYYGQMRIVADSPNYITTVEKADGYDRYDTIKTDGWGNNFYYDYPSIYVDRGRYGKEPSDNLTAEVNWGSLGSLDTKRARHEANKINDAIEHAEAIGKVKTKGVYGRTRDLMDLGEIIRYYERQGLNKATATKMANWYIKNRKTR